MRLLLLGGSPPKSVEEWGLALAVIAASVFLVLPVDRLLGQAVIGSSSGTYLELAVNNAWCHRYSFVASGTATTVDLANHDVSRVGSTSIRQLIVDGAGSVPAYCGSVDQPFVMNEMSFVLVESVLLRAFPDITFAGLGRALAWLRVVLLCVFGVCLVVAGYSLVFAGGLTLAAAYLTVLVGGNALFSQYPFFVPATAVGIAVAGAFLSLGLHRRGGAWLVMSAGLGFWTGFLGNLRTSLYPEAAVAGMLFLWFAARDRREAPSTPPNRIPWLALAFGAWLLGLLVFDATYVRPVRNLPSTVNSSAHGIAHPLVLGLAFPPNALAAREGIEWNDDIGRVLAQRVDPSVSYLGAGYESALFTYYRGLWSRYPSEMFGIYFQKLANTSRSILDHLSSTEPTIFWSAKDGYWLGLSALPLAIASYAVPIPFAFAALFASGWIGWRKRDPGRAFLVSVIGLVGLLAFAESSIILGGVVLWYSSVLLLCTVFAGGLFYQWVLEQVWRLSAALWRATAPVTKRVLDVARQGVGRATRFAAHGVFISATTPRLARVVANCVLIGLVLVFVVPHWFTIERSPTRDADAIARLETAVSLAWCAGRADVGPGDRIVGPGVADRDRMIMPIQSAIEAAFGTVAAFCALPAVHQPFAGRALLLLESTLLRLRPTISFAGLAKALHYLRIVAVVGFVALVMWRAYSLAVGTAAAFAGLWSLVAWREHLFSVQAFGPILILMSAAIIVVAANHPKTRGNRVVFAGIAIASSALAAVAVPGNIALCVLLGLMFACDWAVQAAWQRRHSTMA